MSYVERPDDFELRRAPIRAMSDAELHAHFWDLVGQVVAPLLEEARTHTSPSIERSVLLRMGFSSVESKALVEQMNERRLLGHGAGRLVLELSKSKGMSVCDAGGELLAGRCWDELSL